MFYRNTTLSSSHYAGKWIIPAEDQRYDLKVENQPGLEYAKANDSPDCMIEKLEARRADIINILDSIETLPRLGPGAAPLSDNNLADDRVVSISVKS